ncbi:response regulator [Nocardioides sp.]|uniref:response regulator n=1 Tax=Nocardioides sp. TaxID=35761 RepID=UPI003784A539
MSRPRVVLVDDTADLRQLMRIALRRAGWEVVGEAGDGAAGIEVAREQVPDLVVLDLSMPVMDGLEALPHIRAACPSSTIVVMSGFGATQMTERALARGADGYLQKGTPLSEVVDYLGDALARRGSAASAPSPEAAPTGAASESARTPSAELAELAPVALLAIDDEAELPVRWANDAARRLLGDGVAPRSPLGRTSGQLASFVSDHRIDADTTVDLALADLAGGELRAQATLRRGPSALLLYLDPSAAEAAALRHAIATTAHEIRGPVAVIRGAAETLDDALAADVETELVLELAGSMSRQARILDGLTTDLLTTAQAQHGTLRIELTDVHPADLARAVIAGRYDAELVVTDERMVRADPRRFEQMLSNLLSNAGKYGRPPVQVRVRPAGDLVAIEVADHGDGVPAGFRDQLFREFARAEGAPATGTGLGLHVVRTLAEAQGGTASYAPGPAGGAVFTVELPAV